MSFTPTEGAKATFEKLKTERDAYAQRAETNATYTIPALFPKESDDASTTYDVPYQSIGARGVNNITSKILMAMLPPNQSFFRLGFDPEMQEKINNAGDTTLKEDLEYGLSQMEQVMKRYIESSNMRPTISEAIKQLIVCGNALLFLPPAEGGIKLYKLRDYVVQRDSIGNTIQIVARDVMARGTIPEEFLKNLESAEGSPDEKVEVYTHVYREDDTNWKSYQELGGETLSGTEQTYPLKLSPWIPLRFTKMDGESYGRAFVDDYLGDLVSLEKLSKSIVEMSAIASKALFLVSPGCQTNLKALNSAANGAFVQGRQEDIFPMQLNKYNDLQVAQSTCDKIESRLSYAFLLNSAVQRGGERVTAEEIRYVAGELEDTLGGVYSLLTQELQLPLIRRLFNQLQSQGILPEMKEGMVEPTITTGLEALGRGHDLNRLSTFLEMIVPFGEIAFQRINFQTLITRVASSVGIDTAGLVKTDEELANEQQAAQQQQLEQLGGEAAVEQAVAADAQTSNT